MAAGPFPTKQMHEALKTRVDTLEQAPAGGSEGGNGKVLGLGVRTGVRYLDAMQTGNNLGGRGLRVDLSWRGSAQLVGGFRVAQATLVPADIQLFAVIFGGEVETIFGGPEDLKATTYTIKNKYDYTVETGTEFMLNVPREYQRAAEYGRLVVIFNAAAVSKLPLWTINVEDYPGYLLPGTIFECTYADNGEPTGMAIPIQTAAQGTSAVGVVPPQSMPIVPAPTPFLDEYEDYDKQGGMEIVWPLDGTPYLRVFRTTHSGGSNTAQEYHLVLTPGAPPQ